MKSFFLKFSDSAKSLGDIRTITVTGMLIALAIVIRSLAIQITIDVRIVFTCIPLAIIAMLYGPVVCSMSALAIDIIGFLIDNKSPRGYSIQLALVIVLMGIIYGLVLYKADIRYDKNNLRDSFGSIARIVIARGLVILICNVILNSYFLYTLYINKDFSLSEALSNQDMRNAFLTWWSPRVIKNLIQYPIDCVLLIFTLPVANIAYRSVFKSVRNA